MAEAFLRELFRDDNRVKDGEAQTCVICLETCGTMDPKTGLGEFAIRLPSCQHIVGSGCIAQWFSSNNTCPLCRHVFFAAESGRDREHSIAGLSLAQPRPGRYTGMSERDMVVYVPSDRPQRTRHLTTDFLTSGITTQLVLDCNEYCKSLGLHTGIARLAASVAASLSDRRPPNRIPLYHSNECIAAVSVYIASILTGHPRTSREISAVADNVSRESITAAYNRVGNWMGVIGIHIESQLRNVFNVRNLTLPPDLSELRARESDVQDLMDFCTEYSDKLSSLEKLSSVARRIGCRVWSIEALHRTRRHPPALAAACVYMACYAIVCPRSVFSASDVSHVRANQIREFYRLLYAERREIFQANWLPFLRQATMRSALATLPAP